MISLDVFTATAEGDRCLCSSHLKINENSENFKRYVENYTQY